MKKNTNLLLVFLFTITLWLISDNALSQTEFKAVPYSHIINESDTSGYLITTKPVTNREYIIYLMWVDAVYGADYPEVLWNAVPGLDPTRNAEYFETPNHKTYQTFFKYAEPYLQNYIFNPRYIDYPVIGITWQQASDYCQWLTDRYNEYSLIENKYLRLSATQIGQDCFVTEAYLGGQYEGMVLRETKAKWIDRILIPAFRLPSKSELSGLKTEVSDNQIFKSYPYEKKNFLSQWAKLYLEIEDSAILLVNKIYKNPLERINSSLPYFRIDTSQMCELTLDLNFPKSNKSIVQLFEQNGQHLVNGGSYDHYKDSLGHFPFFIITETQEKIPVYVEEYHDHKSQKQEDGKLYYFRIACCMRIGQYSP